jgi:hypothetical protein
MDVSRPWVLYGRAWRFLATTRYRSAPPRELGMTGFEREGLGSKTALGNEARLRPYRVLVASRIMGGL